MRLSVTPGDELIARYANALGALGKEDGHKAMARAVNRTTNTVHGRVVSALARQTSAPRKIVLSQVGKRTVRPGSGGELEGIVWATGKPLSLKVFNPKQFSYGVKVKVWGKTEKLDGNFIFAGTYRSGKQVGHGHVFERTTTKSLPIELQTGPSLPEELVRGESEKEYERTVADMLPDRIAHEIERLLPD